MTPSISFHFLPVPGFLSLSLSGGQGGGGEVEGVSCQIMYMSIKC